MSAKFHLIKLKTHIILAFYPLSYLGFLRFGMHLADSLQPLPMAGSNMYLYLPLAVAVPKFNLFEVSPQYDLKKGLCKHIRRLECSTQMFEAKSLHSCIPGQSDTPPENDSTFAVGSGLVLLRWQRWSHSKQ